MNPVRKTMTALTLSAAVAAGGWFGYEGLLNAQFAHAKEQVEATREQMTKADDLATVFRSVGKVVEPSVVNIEVHKKVKGARRLPLDPETLKRFFPRDENGQPQIPDELDQGGEDMEQVGTGSGVIMDVDGSTAYVLTNNHVAGGAEEMTVTLSDGREVKPAQAKLVGADPKSDLAVVKIEVDRVMAAKWGNSDDLQKGDWIMAFGSPFGYVGSMTHGIVSALNRQAGILGNQGYESFIQVDAPINPGNSGGPLVNLRGEVVGINTAIASRSGGFQGIGFAIPSNQAHRIYDLLKSKGKVTRGWLGVSIRDVSKATDEAKSFNYDKTEGVFVEEILPKTPAYGKLQPGDIVTGLNGKPVKDVQELRNAIAMTTPNTEVKLNVWREGKMQDVGVKVAEQPEDTMAFLGRGGKQGGAQANPDANSETAGAEKLGLKLQNLTDDLATKFGVENNGGALVTAVTPRSPAFRAGLRPGDLIVKVDRQNVTSAKDAADAIAKGDTGKGVRLYVNSREGSRFVFIKTNAAQQKDKSE